MFLLCSFKVPHEFSFVSLKSVMHNVYTNVSDASLIMTVIEVQKSVRAMQSESNVTSSQLQMSRYSTSGASVQYSLFQPDHIRDHAEAELLTVCVCTRMFVLFRSDSVCVFTFTSHVNVAGVSSSVPHHVMDTCRRRVQL